MKSVVCVGRNDLKIISVKDSLLPARKPNHHLVRVTYSGINPTDWKHLHEGSQYYTATRANKNNHVQLGCEGYGEILEPNDNTCNVFKKGAKVYFLLGKGYGQTNSGSLTEIINVHVDHVAIAPSKLSPKESAVTPLTLLTAYQSLRDAGYRKPNCGEGQSILIHAGAGGVGHMAIQLCSNVYNFSRIVCTCSQDNIEFVKKLGCTDVVNYKVEDFVEKYDGNKFDVVLDTVGGEPTFFYGLCASRSKISKYLERSRMVTKRDGKLIGILTGSTLYGGPCGLFGSMLCSFVPGLLYQLIVRNIFCGRCQPQYVGPYFLPSNKNMKSVSKDLTALAKFIDDGMVAPCVTKEYKLHEIETAINHLKYQGGHTGGLDYSSSNTGEKKSFRGKIAINLMND